jgi:hypothetical protein
MSIGDPEQANLVSALPTLLVISSLTRNTLACASERGTGKGRTEKIHEGDATDSRPL